MRLPEHASDHDVQGPPTSEGTFYVRPLGSKRSWAEPLTVMFAPVPQDVFGLNNSQPIGPSIGIVTQFLSHRRETSHC